MSNVDWLVIAGLIIGPLALIIATFALLAVRRHRQVLAAFTADDAAGGRLPAAQAGAAAAHATQAADSRPSGPPVIIYNPIKVADPEKFEALAREVAQDAELPEPVIMRTTKDDPGAGIARAALAGNPQLMIAAGGDGTVREVASVLAGTDIPLGVIPAGTGNLLARNLHLPIAKTRESLITAFTGSERRIDVGYLSATPLSPEQIHQLRTSGEADKAAEDNPDLTIADGEHAFLVISGLGFDAELMGGTSTEVKKKLGWLAYVVAAVQFMHGTKIRASIASGDTPAREAVTARSVMFANCGILPGGVVLLPDARIDDGWMDLAVIDTVGGMIGWADLSRRVILQGVGIRQDPLPKTGSLEVYRARSFTITTEQPALIEVDGDILGFASQVSARIDHRALTVRVVSPGDQSQPQENEG